MASPGVGGRMGSGPEAPGVGAPVGGVPGSTGRGDGAKLIPGPWVGEIPTAGTGAPGSVGRMPGEGTGASGRTIGTVGAIPVNRVHFYFG